MITDNDSLQNLRVRAGKLASAAESLATLLEQEAIRLKRGDEVARLKALRVAIARRIESARSEENSASSRYEKIRAIRSVAGFVTGLIAKTNNDGLEIISHALIQPPVDGKPPFGTVLVRIGPGGVPEDVDVVSVSRLARDSRREQFRVIQDLKKAQNLLLTEENFSGL